MMVKKVDILGVGISVIDPLKAVALLKCWIAQRFRCYVCVAPVATLVDCQRMPEYRQVVNAAAMVTPDGMPVVWLTRAKGYCDIERTYGPDLMRNMCDQGRALSLRHFLYGSTAETLKALEAKLIENYPGILVSGSYSPPFLVQARQEPDEIINLINGAKPDIVWVGLGSPKQDFWMSLNRARIDAPVLVGIGAAFDFISGAKPQAPRWMQHSGLEWLFRFCCEPRRLWKRYLISNTLFIFYIIRSLLTRK